jgi:DNA-binding transcriptional LysR family regulator
MDSRYEKFLALADTGSFSKAARSLHITQPAVSLAVASLERSLKAKLYERRRSSVALTAEGMVVARAARAMKQELDAMHAQLQSTAGSRRSRVALIDSLAHLLHGAGQPTLFADQDIIVENSRQILADLQGGRIDLGIITGQQAPLGADMTVRKLHDEPFVFVAGPGRVPHHKVTRIDDWLAPDPESTTYRYFTTLFAERGMVVTPVFHSASMELLRDMAIAGNGTALLPRHIVQDALAAGQLAVVKTRPLHRPIWAVTPGKRRREPLALELQLNTMLAQNS